MRKRVAYLGLLRGCGTKVLAYFSRATVPASLSVCTLEFTVSSNADSLRQFLFSQFYLAPLSCLLPCLKSGVALELEGLISESFLGVWVTLEPRDWPDGECMRTFLAV